MKRFLVRAHRGTSLVEILVAMVILLVGIYSLVRLFPSGFTSIIYGRNVSQAHALTSGILEVARVRYDTLPNAVIAINPVTLAAYPELPVADELLAFTPPAGGPPDARFSDINKVRHVLGEAAKIPAPTTGSPYMPADGASGQRLPVSVYILNFSPLYSVTPTVFNGKPTGQGGIVVYSGTPLKRIVFNGPPDDQELAALDENSYGIDYGNATVYFKPATYPRRFKADCSFTVSPAANSFLHDQMRPDNCLYVPANTQAYDLRQPHPNQPADCPFLPLPAGARLEQDEESVYRAFDLLAGNESFSSTDPYQFRVLNNVVGVIGFNPLAATLRSAGGKGIVAKLDYDVNDWHIIHDDRTVPFSPPHTVKLTLNNIERIGAVDEYQETYTSLIKGYPDRPALNTGTVDVDVLVVDLETGLTLDSRTLQRLDEEPFLQNSTNEDGEISYLNGSIRFRDAVRWTLPAAGGPKTSPEPIAGKRIRVYYRTQQNWGVQLTKAFTNYVRETDPLNLGYGEFALGTKGYLFFPIQDHDQSVLVDYTWVQRENGQDIQRTETGELHQVLNPTDVDSPQNQQGSPFPYWWAQVDGAKRADAVPDSVRVQRVRGVTVRARAIWREGERWRRLDLDSFVSRDRGT